MLIPILFSLAAVLYNYFGLYVKLSDKISDMEKVLRKDINDVCLSQTVGEVKQEAILAEHSKKLELLPIIDNKQAKLEAQLSVYFKTLDPFLAAAIHSPIHVERDGLMEKLEGDTLTYEEAIELEHRLEDAIKEEKNGNKTWYEILALGRVRSIIVGFEFDQQREKLTLNG
jgi:hypothetical protein